MKIIGFFLVALALALAGCSDEDFYEMSGFVNVKDTRSAYALKWDTVYYSAEQHQIIYKDQKVYMSDEVSGYGTGIFICDISNVYGDLYFSDPENYVIEGCDHPRCGYRGSVATATPKRGTYINNELSPDGKYKRLLTTCYKIKYDMSGKKVSRQLLGSLSA